MLEKIIGAAGILCVILLCMSCISQSSIRDNVEADVIKCLDLNEIKLNEYVLNNNTWNRGGVREYTQCIFKVQKDSLFPVGWKWEWPSVDNQVRAYPEIIYGWKPWESRSTANTLPIQISMLKQLTVTYEIETEVEGRYNLAFDIWLTRSSRPAHNNISTELMIWLDRNGMMPAGMFVENVMIADEWYELFMGTPGHANWMYIAFVRINPELEGDTQIHKFVSYLVENNHISEQEYIASVEFGNEIISGSGETILKRYEISVK